MLDTLYRFAIVMEYEGHERLLASMYDDENEAESALVKMQQFYFARYRVARIQITELPDEMPESTQEIDYNDYAPLI